MKSLVYKFRLEIKVNLAPYFFALSKYIKISQKPCSLLTKSETSFISLQQFTFGFIDFNLGWMTLTTKIGFFKVNDCERLPTNSFIV